MGGAEETPRAMVPLTPGRFCQQAVQIAECGNKAGPPWRFLRRFVLKVPALHYPKASGDLEPEKILALQLIFNLLPM